MNRYNRRETAVISYTDAAIDLVPLADAKAFLRLDGDADDDLLAMFIGAAVDAAERYMSRALRRQTIELTLDGFPGCNDDALDRLGPGMHVVSLPYLLGRDDGIDLPFPPVLSITSLTTYSAGNVAALMDAAGYLLDGFRVTLNQGYTWPTDLRDRAAVKIRYLAGYGSAAMPASIKIALMAYVAAMYDCRSICSMPGDAIAGLSAYRIADGLTW